MTSPRISEGFDPRLTYPIMTKVGIVEMDGRRAAAFREHRVYPFEDLGWISPEEAQDLRTKLMTCELDLQHAEAVIDGSWPNADEWIKTARERRKP